MKKTVLCAVFVLFGLNMLCAQTVLPGYNGFFSAANGGDRKLTVLDLVNYYPDKLPFLRNEIYARYGRPFVNKTYQDYFKAQSWYVEKSNFSESWLTQNDKDNAEFISALEKSIRNLDAVTTQVLRNIEYTGGEAVLTFTSKRQVVWSDDRVNFHSYANNWYGKQTMDWIVMGDWFLVYAMTYNDSALEVIAYQLDHAKKRIIGSAQRVFEVETGGRYASSTSEEILSIFDLMYSQGRRPPLSFR